MKYFVNKPLKEKGVLATMYFNSQQIKDITKDAGDAGYLLMTYYVGIAQQRDPNMEDTQLAALTGKSVKTVADTRRKLTRSGWFKRTVVNVAGEKHFMYLVGKDAVSSGFKNSAASTRTTV